MCSVLICIFSNSATGTLQLTSLGHNHHVVGVKPGDSSLVVTHTTPAGPGKTKNETIMSEIYKDVKGGRKMAKKGVTWLQSAEKTADSVVVGAEKAAHVVAETARTVQKVAGHNIVGEVAGAVGGAAAVMENTAQAVSMEIEGASRKTQQVAQWLGVDSNKRSRVDEHALPMGSRSPSKASTSTGRTESRKQINSGMLKAAKQRLKQKQGAPPANLHLTDVQDVHGDNVVTSVATRENAALDHHTHTAPQHHIAPGNHQAVPVQSAAGVHYHTDARQANLTHPTHK